MEYLYEVLSLSPNATGIYTGENITILAANDAMLALWSKKRDIIGKPMGEGVPELRGQPFLEILKNVYLSGEDYQAEDMSAELLVNGKLQTRYFDFLYKAIKNQDGETECILHTATDVTSRHLSMEKVGMLDHDLKLINIELIAANERLNVINEELILAQKESEQERQRLSDFVMQAPAGICVLRGQELVYELVNPAYQRLIPGRQLIGKPIFEALPELAGQPIEEILLNVYHTGKSQTQHDLPIPVASLEGGEIEERYFTFNYLPIKDSVSGLKGIMAFVYEVTEQVVARKKVEESELHFRYLADLVPAKINNAAANGEITFFNKQWLDFSNMSFEEFRDFGYYEMMHPEEIPEFQERLKISAQSGVPLEMEMRFRNIHGKYIWHLNIVSPILDEHGQIKMWVGSTTDIQKLKEEEQRKGDFVSMLSHELKTPVTSIKGYVQLLLKAANQEEETLFSGKMKTSLVRIDKLVVQLTNLISDMLDLTRIETDRVKMKMECLNLKELVEEIKDDFSFINPKHQINVNYHLDAMVMADKNKISQVLINFVSNAIKYAPHSEVVDISIFKTEDGMAAVSVRDYGIGIDEKEHQKVFERFYRVEEQSTQIFSGFGIGLFIAKSIISRHHGQITIDSQVGKGSVFTLMLPVMT
ncbi:PAS domain S-box-containing protein [Pedobacter cryoconitis]|uniref:histidine kinase n=1 Tax=Pedobacter cryoconitis TaxID=188932 RepID=A0A7W8ZMQ7_9SPHI|nr:PAS domain-containing protein [Pedobacter cryoconitis]MBB5636836.1 PAS domain S-box-containing protein [Pedobacter cryoconitis]